MSVRIDGERIMLEGRCSAEDAEALLVALQNGRGMTVDVRSVQRLHMAVLQILIAVRPPVEGTPAVPFLPRNIFDRLISTSDSAPDFS